MGYLNDSANGVCYIGAVKWDIDNKDVFIPNGATKATMHNFFINTLRKINGNIIFAHPNEYIDIEAKIENIEKVNYCYYKNDSEFSNTYYCCFVTNWEMIAENTTRLYLKLDVLQQYYFDTTFYRSRINRGHIKRANDDYHKYTLAEPCYNTGSLYDYNIGEFGSEYDWRPRWMAELYVRRNTSGEWVQAGWGSGENASSVMGMRRCANVPGDIIGTESMSELSHQLKIIYKLDNDAESHKSDIVGLVPNPTWMYSNAGIRDYNDYVGADGNLVYTQNYTQHYNNNQLPNGYTPRNKKLLSSAFRVLTINNRNGFRLPLKPELITSNYDNIVITLQKRFFNNYQILFQINNYRDFSSSISTIPYSASMNLVYDSNTGINKALNVMGGISGIVGATAGTVSSIASNNIAGAVSGVANMAQAGVGLASAFADKPASIGSCSDTNAISYGMIVPRLYDSCPSLEECQSADDFLDAYGYRLESIEAVTDYLHSRQQYNYIQTDDININLWAPANWVLEFKNIFNSGVRIWHDYNNFGNLGVNNPDE